MRQGRFELGKSNNYYQLFGLAENFKRRRDSAAKVALFSQVATPVKACVVQKT
ncbi:MAG: hypothetical protein HGB11_02940 [Chlorobiales bacterium]|nr:hypothetical protein [Chlorobiales bacterium]